MATECPGERRWALQKAKGDTEFGVLSGSTPPVLGADDCAFRQPQPCGTMLIDLNPRQPVALLPDRQIDTLAQ
jgi:hypothetical protein